LPERFVESILEAKDLQQNYGDFAAVKGITYQNQFIKREEENEHNKYCLARDHNC
jgi:hypothetical protein